MGEAQVFADFGRDFRERRLEHRQIFADELLLQVDGVRGYDDALAVLDGVYRGGEQICERFPNAGAGFDDEARAGVDGFGYRPRHLYLLRALLEAWNGRGERAAGGQRFLHRADVYGVGGFGCADCGRLREAPGELASADEGRGQVGGRGRSRRREFLRRIEKGGGDVPLRAPRQPADFGERPRVERREIGHEREKQVADGAGVLQRAMRARVRDGLRARQLFQRV